MATLNIVSDNFENNEKGECLNLKRKCGQASSNGKYLNKRKRKTDGIVLPTKFLLGGNINDPLNLASLSNESNQITPKSSPIPTPKYKKEIDVLIPANINDPLSLNTDEELDKTKLITFKAIRKSKRRKRKRTDSENTLDEEDEGNETSRPNNEKLYATSNQEMSSTSSTTSIQTTPLASTSSVLVEKPTGSGFRNKIDTIKFLKVEEKKGSNFFQNNRQFQAQHRFRAKDVKFQYGNYNRYYGYRNLNTPSDLRLKQFDKAWFENLNVLDIGCNVGHVTLTIAKNFQPKKITGLDIDENLIRVAKKNIRHYLEENKNLNQLQFKSSVKKESISSEVNLNQTSEFSISQSDPTNKNLLKESETNQSKVLESKESNQPLIDSLKNDFFSNSQTKSFQNNSETKEILNFSSNSKCIVNFPNNVNFITGNYVLENDEQLNDENEEYDCILCLSVTKWIHLNFGDSGLKRAFKRMYAQLKPGGILILEAQPWCSYKKKKYLTECTLNNYWSIKFKPEHFNDYLLSREVGFNTLQLIDKPAHESKGFRRPIYLFRKTN